MQQRDYHTKELSKNMKFQEIILYENRKLSRQLLILNQALCEERNERFKAIQLMQQKKVYEKTPSDNNAIQTQILDLRRKYDIAQQRVTDLECELARQTQEYINSINEKETKVKDTQLANTQMKTEIKQLNQRVKELENELASHRTELNSERSKRSSIEASAKNENLLKQSYDKVVQNLKTQKAHIDEIQKNQNELYKAIEDQKVQLVD